MEFNLPTHFSKVLAQSSPLAPLFRFFSLCKPCDTFSYVKQIEFSWINRFLEPFKLFSASKLVFKGHDVWLCYHFKLIIITQKFDKLFVPPFIEFPFALCFYLITLSIPSYPLFSACSFIEDEKKKPRRRRKMRMRLKEKCRQKGFRKGWRIEIWLTKKRSLKGQSMINSLSW